MIHIAKKNNRGDILSFCKVKPFLDGQGGNMFRLGDTVQFNSTGFVSEFWSSLSEQDKKQYYGDYGYGDKLKLFTFITEHYPQFGHCVLVEIGTGKMLTMCHISDFRLVTDEEC